MMTTQQKELSKIACVPKGKSTKKFPEIMDTDGILSYPTLFNDTVAGLVLLVSMSPVFGEPILLPVNHCLTDIAALKNKSTIKVIKNNKTVKKQICIKEELYNNAPFNFIGITAGAQLYFAPGSLEKKRNPFNNKRILEDALLPAVLQTWMSVNF